MSNNIDDDGNALLSVLISNDGQFSFWPIGVDSPTGWRATGMQGTREDCRTFVKVNWTDMRPLGLREQIGEFKNSR